MTQIPCTYSHEILESSEGDSVSHVRNVASEAQKSTLPKLRSQIPRFMLAPNADHTFQYASLICQQTFFPLSQNTNLKNIQKINSNSGTC